MTHYKTLRACNYYRIYSYSATIKTHLISSKNSKVELNPRLVALSKGDTSKPLMMIPYCLIPLHLI